MGAAPAPPPCRETAGREAQPAPSQDYQWDSVAPQDGGILAALQTKADAAGHVDWTLHFVDGSVVRAHQHAAGAKKGRGHRRWDGVKAATARRSTSGSTARGSRSSSS